VQQHRRAIQNVARNAALMTESAQNLRHIFALVSSLLAGQPQRPGVCVHYRPEFGILRCQLVAGERRLRRDTVSKRQPAVVDPGPRFQKRGPGCCFPEPVGSGCCMGHEPRMFCRRAECSRLLPNRGLPWQCERPPREGLDLRVQPAVRNPQRSSSGETRPRRRVDRLAEKPLVRSWVHVAIQGDLSVNHLRMRDCEERKKTTDETLRHGSPIVVGKA